MSEAQQDWRTMFAAATSEGESIQLEPMIDDTELAIQHQLKEEIENSPATSEEAELHAALRVLKRMRAQLLTAA